MARLSNAPAAGEIVFHHINERLIAGCSRHIQGKAIDAKTDGQTCISPTHFLGHDITETRLLQW